MIDKDFIQEVIERASEEGVPYNHKFECVYKLIQNFILVHDMESNEGQALLYAVEKTAERTKREIFLKVAEWLGRNIHKYAENIRITRLISDLKQAMYDERKDI